MHAHIYIQACGLLGTTCICALRMTQLLFVLFQIFTRIYSFFIESVRFLFHGHCLAATANAAGYYATTHTYTAERCIVLLVLLLELNCSYSFGCAFGDFPIFLFAFALCANSIC